MSLPVSGIPSTSFVPTSSDEAASLTSFVAEAESAFRTEVARARLDSALSLISRLYEQLKAVTLRLVDRLSQALIPVTTDSLAKVQKSEAALRKLFADDGPNLGVSLAEADALYNDIVGSGVSLEAPVMTPVLLERFDAKGKTLSTSFNWLSSAQIATISQLPSGGVSSYPGSTLREAVLKDDKNKVIETTRFTVFSSYSNRRPTSAALASTISSINGITEKTSELLKAELLIAGKVINEVKEMHSQFAQFKDENNQSISQARAARGDSREDFLRRERIIRRERDLKAIQFDSSLGISNASPAPPEQAASPYSVSAVGEAGMASETERSRDFKRAQDQKGQVFSNQADAGVSIRGDD